jgi:uncharacterized C2H2 Zn-finger protein
MASTHMARILTGKREHLMRTHRIFRCARCQEIFRKSNDLNIHLRQVTSCQLRDKNPDEEHDWGQGFDEDQANKLKTRIRKMQQRETGDEQKWREWYKILFPNDTAIPSPCKLTTFRPSSNLLTLFRL